MIESIGLTVGMMGGLAFAAIVLILTVVIRTLYVHYKRGGVGELHPTYPYSQGRYTQDDFETDRLGSAIIMWSVIAFTAVVWALALIPYDSTYWQSYAVSGTVESVSDQFVAGTGDVSYGERIITVEGVEQAFLVTNPRVLVVKPGEDVSLTCNVEWVFRNADRWSCDLRSS